MFKYYVISREGVGQKIKEDYGGGEVVRKVYQKGLRNIWMFPNLLLQEFGGEWVVRVSSFKLAQFLTNLYFLAMFQDSGNLF